MVQFDSDVTAAHVARCWLAVLASTSTTRAQVVVPYCNLLWCEAVFGAQCVVFNPVGFLAAGDASQAHLVGTVAAYGANQVDGVTVPIAAFCNDELTVWNHRILAI
jgi:hypothetical protein